MSSVSCSGNLFVAWTATIGTAPNPEFPTEAPLDITVGRISQFEITSPNGPRHTRTMNYDWCNEMGSIHTSEDCSVLTVLCRSKSVVGIDLVAKAQKSGKGWTAPNRADLTRPNYRLIDNMYLLEFTSGLAVTPSKTVLINKAIGGWNFGHFDLALNSAKTTYLVTLKVSHWEDIDVDGDEGRWLEGSNTFMVHRNWTLGHDTYGCGNGFVFANRVTYDKRGDTFSLYCWAEGSTTQSPANAINFRTAKVSRFHTAKQLLSLPYSQANGGLLGPWGGAQNLVNLGQHGFLGVGLGPIGGTVSGMNTVGLITLPINSNAFNPNTHRWKWFKSIVTAKTKDQDQIAFPNLQVMGLNQNRYLLGWASRASKTGVPGGSFKIVEVDSNGCMRGPITTLTNTGWGGDNLWTYVPSTGCVVMTYAFETSPFDPFGSCAEGCVNSRKMRLTTVCPDEAVPASSSCSVFAVGEEEGEVGAVGSGVGTAPIFAWVLVAVGIVLVVTVVVVVVSLSKRKQEETV